MAKYVDGEVIRIDTDGCLVQWDDILQQEYNCGETLEEFGIDNLTNEERERLGLL